MAEPFLKHDHGKPAFDLLPPRALADVSAVLGYGANKYAAHNWRKATRWGRYSAAALRHVFAWLSGEDLDKESGLPHLAHATCCLLFLLELQSTGVGEDDRWREERES